MSFLLDLGLINLLIKYLQVDFRQHGTCDG
jgi:hypothetical protein